jgi:uncharacterized protein (TIGR03437 family)
VTLSVVRNSVAIIRISACLSVAAALISSSTAAVVNEAQRNGPQRIAPGSIVLIASGLAVAPETAQFAEGFPLVTNLAGASVQITVGDKAVNAYILAVEFEWVRALVPSNTPPGDGRLIVTYNGRESAPHPIRIAERGFAIFDGTYEDDPGPSFRFPRAVQNVTVGAGTRLNSLADSARPGGLVVLWGTGLGATPANEAAGPAPGAMTIAGLTVFVGGRPAQIVYAGRSGCCAGMDQIIFQVPPGIEGCSVPVWVRYSEDGQGSNPVYVSISAGGGACSDPHGLLESESAALSKRHLRAARIHALTDAAGVEWTMDLGVAENGNRIPLGTCVQAGWDSGPFAINLVSRCDAGQAIRIRSERVAVEALKRGDVYVGRSSGPVGPAEYVFESTSIGADVNSFRAAVSVPALPSFTWTNRDSLQSASMADGVTVTWTGGDRTGFVTISGVFDSGGESWGNGGFVCLEQADRGAFTIPPTLLARLASDWLGRPTYPGANSLHVWVTYTTSRRFDIRDFGSGEFQISERVDPKSVATVGLRP